MWRIVKWVLIAGVVLFALIQIVPYGRTKDAPAVTLDAPWTNPQARELAVIACYDCHSNETVHPWYSYIAPVSWLLQRDIDNGREELNFSHWDQPQPNLGAAPIDVRTGRMPPGRYLLLHGSAKLDDAEKQILINGLEELPEPPVNP